MLNALFVLEMVLLECSYLEVFPLTVVSKGSSSEVVGLGGICAAELQVRVSNDGPTRPFPPVRCVSLLCQFIAKPTRLENATMP